MERDKEYKELVIDIEQWKVKECRGWLLLHGLSITGNKDMLHSEIKK